MNKLLLAATLAIACAAGVHGATVAPSDANITGHVIDSETGEHLPFVKINIKGTQILTITDAGGHYTLRNLTPGSVKIEVSCTGYSSQTKDVELKRGITQELNFEIAPDAFMLDQVVVTSSKSEQKRRNSSSLIEVLPADMFQRVDASSLADGLSFQPGVRVENDCQNCGFTQVRINGLDGHYSQILMNSRPVFSALTGVYGLEQIPANMIERVEVMRGGGSALFGSSAIGGTINIITREPLSNYAEAAHQLTFIGCSGKTDNNTTLNASVVNDNTRLGLTFYAQNRVRQGYDHNADGFTEIAEIKSQTLGLRTFARPNDNLKLQLEYHTTHEYRRGGDSLALPPHQALIAEQVEHNINGGELSADYWNTSRSSHLNAYLAAQNTNRRSYYGSFCDPNAYGCTHDLVITSGFQFTHSLTRFLFMPVEIVAGAEYSYNYLRDVTLGYNHNETQRVNIISGYLQNEWRTDMWGLLIGARLDHHSMVNHPIISPRVNIRFNPTASLNFRLSYSTGFRAPQAYDEDFHVAIVGGERIITILAPNLREEKSNSLSASADYYFTLGSTLLNFTLEGFYTNLSHVFALRKLNELDALGNAVLERYNGSGATVAGINAEAGLKWRKLQFQGGATWQRSRYKTPEQWSEDPDVPPATTMFRTPDIYGYFTGSYTVWRKLALAANATFTGPMTVQHMAGPSVARDIAVRTPSFADLSARLTYEFTIMHSACLELSLGIKNILNSYQRDFDSGPMRDSGYIYGPAIPRSLTIGLKLHL